MRAGAPIGSRSMAWWKLSLLVAWAGCAHAPDAELSGPTLELRLDDGAAAEKTLLPERQHELLIRFDPSPIDYVPLTLHLLLAAPGQVTLTFYRTSPEGNPGQAVQRVERDYSAAYVSSGKDGRWLIERLSIPTQRAPLWVGLSGSAAVWSSPRDSTWVFQRDPNPAVTLYSNRLTRTPLVRLTVAPTR